VYLVAVVAAPRQGTNIYRAYMSYEHTTYELSKIGCSQLVTMVVVKQRLQQPCQFVDTVTNAKRYRSPQNIRQDPGVFAPLNDKAIPQLQSNIRDSQRKSLDANELERGRIGMSSSVYLRLVSIKHGGAVVDATTRYLPPKSLHRPSDSRCPITGQA
jgi:hypothetical protein